MTYPLGVVTRTITVGDSLAVESGTGLTVRAALRSSRGLVWVATGERAVSAPEVRESATAGDAVSFTPPVTDQAGWRDLATGALIDVSAANSHTHTYTIELVTLRDGRPVDRRFIGPFPLPTGDGTPVDADLLIAADTVPGLLVSVPDALTPRMDALESEVSDLGGSIGDAVADYLTANPPSGSPDATALTKGIVRLAGDLGGTADAPTVPGLADKADTDHRHVLADITDYTAPPPPPDLSGYATTSAVASALAGKAEKAALHTHPAVIAQGANAADARTAIGAGTSSFSGAYADLTGKPTLGTAAATAATDYATATHTHDVGDLDATGTPSATTYLRGDGTWATPAGGGGGGSAGVTATNTPTAPADGESASYLVTSAVSWPAGLVWSTDPDGGTAPTVTGTALVSLFTVGGTTRAIMGATFPGGSEPDPTDTTAPTWTATLTTGVPDSTSVTVTATALATDDVMVTGYESSVDSGATWQPITPAGAVFTLTGLTEDTSYPAPQLRATDAAGNTSAPLTAQAFTTAAAAASLSAAILAASPAGYWKMDETTGKTFADSSGNSRTATAGATAPQLATLAGPAGTGSYVNFQNGASTATVPDDDAFSINTTGGLTLAFLKRSTNAGDANMRTVLAKGGEWSGLVRHNATSGGMDSRVLSPTSQVQQMESTAFNLPVNTWTLHVVRFEGTTAGNRHQHFINGVLQASTRGTLGAAQTYGNTTSAVGVGSSDARGIAHAAIFPTALTPAQIAYIADAARSEGWIA